MFFFLSTPPLCRQFSSPNPLRSQLRTTLFSRERGTCKRWVFGRGLEGPPPQGETKEFSLKKCRAKNVRLIIRIAPDTFNFLRHVMRAILSGRPKCSHRCVSLKETPLKPVQILKHTTKNSAEQTSMRTKWFKHVAI